MKRIVSAIGFLAFAALLAVAFVGPISVDSATADVPAVEQVADEAAAPVSVLMAGNVVAGPTGVGPNWNGGPAATPILEFPNSPVLPRRTVSVQ